LSTLDFLSPSRCAADTLSSPLRRALETVSDTGVRKDGAFGAPSGSQRLVGDLSLHGNVEIRGDLDFVQPLAGEELVRLSHRRGFLFTSDDPAGAATRIREQGVLAYDVTGGWAGFALVGERLMRRLTDLDLDALPAAGPFARVPAIVLRDEGERFRVYVPQELGHDVVLAVRDAIDGLTSGGGPNTGVRLKPDPKTS
jgi:hypothetical protein